MKKQMFIAAALVAVMAGGVASAVAQPPLGGPGIHGPGRGHRGGGPLGDLGLRGLELTDAQRDQVRAIMDAQRSAIEEAARKLREAQRALAHATHATPIDEAAVRAHSTALAAAIADEAILQARIRGEVHGLLTAEQLQQLQERRDAMQKRLQEQQERMQERRQQRQTRPPGQ